MSLCVAMTALLLLAGGEPETLSGTVRLTAGVPAPAVSLLVAANGSAIELSGELVTEVAALQGAKVEVVGLRDGRTFVVQHYRILALEAGGRPAAVGRLVPSGGGLALTDGDGAPIPLNLSPKLRMHLEKVVGGRIWVLGKKLLSGEIKVSAYGVLREPPRVEPPPASEDPQPD